MTRSFRIGRVYGIDIEVDYTWFIIFALLVYGLASPSGLLAGVVPSSEIGVRVLVAVFTTLLFFTSVLLHELSHSIVAIRNGMSISGITLFIFGGVSKMTDEPPSPGVEFRMAIAGPLASFALAVIFYLLAQAVARSSPVFATVFVELAFINGVLGAFNLLPGFPLDGGRVLRSGLWSWLRSLGEATRIAATFGQGLGIIMIVGGVFLFLGVPQARFNGLWLAFIGWFLIQAAQSNYQQVMVRQALSDIKVRDVMTTAVDSVGAEATLEEVVHDHIMSRSHPAYPVFQDSELLGLLSLTDIKHVPRDRRYYVTARDVVPPLSDEQTISPNADVWEALTKMMTNNQGRLLVMEDGRLVGILSRSDILRVMRTRMALGT